MAVVIRDRGRPPDRRWQLFTNFYQVIRRREANRNLPDTNLAKLLREDEQLLKTVHNRLGFVLQARAETSRGAQTSLNRAEFKELVQNAVELMKEGDVDSIVKVLMEATTDRLVLVSTPDDGNSVRFDIRPLQEFFAAEFLYESVDAEELRQRLEILGGDSHWREVIHFLMSALIENNRKTDLTVAISVLEQLNEGDSDANLRLLNRRLCRGALLAARILQEGVLEQDKRMRQRFRNAIEPLAGSTAFDQLAQLVETHQPESKEWLISFFTDVLQELNWTENIGAALVLLEILPDGDARVEQVSAILLEAPAEYLGVIFTEQSNPEFSRKHSNHKWVGDVVLKLLLSANWTALGSSVISKLIGFLRSAVSAASRELVLAGLSPLERDLMSTLLLSHPQEVTESDVDCGFVRFAHYITDWTTEGTLKFSESAPHPRGMLDLVYRVLIFHSARTLDNLRRVLKVAAPDFKLLEVLPDTLSALWPIDEHSEFVKQCEELLALNNAGFVKLLESHQVGSRLIARPLRIVQFSAVATFDDWKCVLANYPEFAPEVWSDIFWRHVFNAKMPSSFESPEFVNALIDKLLQFPRLLLPIANKWGHLIEVCPEREIEIRQALLTLPTHPSPREYYLAIDPEFHAFRLDLPSESSLLPHLVTALSEWLENAGMEWRSVVVDSSRPQLDVTQMINALVGAFRLQTVFEDSRYESGVRASAMLMYLMREHRRGLTGEGALHLVDLYVPNIGNWFFDATVTQVGLISDGYPEKAKALVSAILDIARSDYDGRTRLDWLLTRWRETSAAPVRRAGVQEQWLRGA